MDSNKNDKPVKKKVQFPVGTVITREGVTLKVVLGDCRDCYFVKHDLHEGYNGCNKSVRVWGTCCGYYRDDAKWVCFKEVKK